jgi:hypothetical protein
MDWITVDNFRADFAVARKATDPQGQMAIEAAEDELVELVGQEAVDDTLTASPADTVRAGRIVRAHKFLAAAVHCLNARNVKREQSDESAGMGSNNVNNEYWNPKEIAEMRENWRALALRAIGPYLLTDADGDAYGTEPEFAEGAALTDDCCGAYAC